MDAYDAVWLVVVMLPFLGLAFAALAIGYMSYRNGVAREAAARAPPPGPDPADEVTRVNTEIARQLAQGRLSLERARDAMQRGLKG